MTVYRRALTLMEAEMGDEIVALDPEGGTCFGFNPVAAGVWQLLAEPRTFDELHGALLAEYEIDPQQCAEDLQSLLHDMAGKGLIAES